jgi:hypothetical protein
MTDALRNTLRAACVGGALLVAALGCNDIGREGDIAEAVPLVTDVAISGQGAADGLDTVVSLTVKIEDRTGGGASSFFNEVLFTDYEVTFTLLSGAGPAPAAVTGLINSGYVPMGGTITLDLEVVAEGSEPSGSSVAADIRVNGHDLLGRPVAFEHRVIIEFT